MDNSEQQTENMIRFLDGELSGRELETLNADLSADPGLRAELENLQLAREAVQHYGLRKQVAAARESLKAEMAAAGKEKRGAIPLLSVIMRIAAVLLLVIAGFGGYEYVIVSRGNLLSEPSYYSLGIERDADGQSAIALAYAKKDYPAVVRLFEGEANPASKEQLLAGLSYMYTGMPGQAIRVFDQIRHAGAAGDYHDDAEYYLALSLLKTGELQKAKSIFTKIRHDQDHIYHNKVSGLTLFRLDLLILKSNQK